MRKIVPARREHKVPFTLTRIVIAYQRRINGRGDGLCHLRKASEDTSCVKNRKEAQ